MTPDERDELLIRVDEHTKAMKSDMADFRDGLKDVAVRVGRLEHRYTYLAGAGAVVGVVAGGVLSGLMFVGKAIVAPFLDR